MDTITLFNQDDLTVLLCDLHFDTEIDGVRATIEIQNRNNICVNVRLVDLWDGERFYDDYCHSLCSVSPGETKKADFLEINSVYEDDSILMFFNGYLPAFSFRVALYIHEKDEDFLECYSKGNKVVISKFSMDGVAVMPDESFNIDSDGTMLFASAKHYIPFEIPKANVEKAQQIQAFKDELTDRIDTMEIAPWEVLVAKYGEIGKPRFYDIENMCIYNLGTSTFSRCCPYDIAFEELTAKEIALLQKQYKTKTDQAYFYTYTPMPREKLEEKCNSQRLIAEWSHIVIDTDLPNTPHRYWASIRKQYECVNVHQVLQCPKTDGFGIKIVVHLPRRLLPAGVMKPLLDGIVCAFHERDSIDDLLHTITQDDFEKMANCAEKSIAVLGKRNYVQPHRDGFKWNPADERLKFAWVSVVTEECDPYFEGKIFAWDI